MTVHLIYVKGERISTPFAITNELAKRLELKYKVKVYNYDETIIIKPDKGDILIGHPYPFKGTIFRNSINNPNWSKVILMIPFHHNIIRYNSVMEDLYKYIDVFLAICGNYWYSTIGNSVFSHWQPITKHLDLAVNRDKFKFFRNYFNPKGQRKFIYIGSSSWKAKGTNFLAKISLYRKDIEFAWAGIGKIKKNNLKYLGVLDFSKEEDLNKIKEYDFLISTGRSDANPTTILEAASWGLIPVCTKECGYDNEEWIINIPLDNLKETSIIIDKLNNLPEDELFKLQELSQKRLDEYYKWDRFTQVVIDAIESEKPLKHKLTYKQNINRIYLKISSYFYKFIISIGNTNLLKVFFNKINYILFNRAKNI